MQINNKSTDNRNIMDEFRDAKNGLINGYRANLLKYAYQRNPDSILDETLLGIWALMGVSILFTVGFGAYYHWAMFQSAFEVGIISVVGSFLVFIVLEITKIFFGLVCIRGLFSGLTFRSFHRLAFMVLVGFVSFFAFRWSIDISTKGIAQVNSYLKQTELTESTSFVPPPSIAALDAQIAALESSKKAGAKATWKGRTTQQGLGVIADNTALQSKLVEQREKEMAAARAAFEESQNLEKTQIAATATLLTDYGGKAEIVQIVCLFLIVLFEIINWQKNKPTQPTQPVYKDLTHGDTVALNVKRPIGFQQGHTAAQHNEKPCDTSDTAVLTHRHNPPTQHSDTSPPNRHTTTVIVAPSVDLSQVKNHCREYYRRSLKQTSDNDTRERNRGKYLEFRTTLELAGHTVTELENGFLDIKKAEV